MMADMICGGPRHGDPCVRAKKKTGLRPDQDTYNYIYDRDRTESRHDRERHGHRGDKSADKSPMLDAVWPTVFLVDSEGV